MMYNGQIATKVDFHTGEIFVTMIDPADFYIHPDERGQRGQISTEATVLIERPFAEYFRHPDERG